MSYGDYFDPSKPVTVEGDAAIQSQVAVDKKRKQQQQQDQQDALRGDAAARARLDFTGTSTIADQQDPLSPAAYAAKRKELEARGQYAPSYLMRLPDSAVIPGAQRQMVNWGGLVSDIVGVHKARDEMKMLDASQSQAERAQAARRASLAGRIAGTAHLDPDLIYGILNGDAGAKDVLSTVQKQQEEERLAAEHTEEKTTSASHYDAEQARLTANDKFSHDNADRSYNLTLREQLAREAEAADKRNNPAPKPLTEGDKRARVLYQEMADATKQLNTATGEGMESYSGNVLSSNQYTRPLASSDFKQHEAAGLRWAQNYLYLKTGQSAPDGEVRKAFQMYLPQPGDSPAVIKQKADARAQAENGIRNVYSIDSGANPGTGEPSNVIHYDANGNRIGGAGAPPPRGGASGRF